MGHGRAGLNKSLAILPFFQVSSTGTMEQSPTYIPWLHFERISIDPYFLPGILWAGAVYLKDLSPLNLVVGQSLHLSPLYKQKFTLLLPRPRLANFVGDPTFLSKRFCHVDLKRHYYLGFIIA